MGFIKRHLFLLGCGLAALVSIGLAAAGVVSMSSIEDDMQSVAGLAGQVRGLERTPANDVTIKAERAHNEAVEAEYTQVLASARQGQLFVIDP